MRNKRVSIPALAVVIGAGPFSTDTYISALPDLQADLHTTAAAAQLTITFCIAGLAGGMLFAGPFSDRYGRRPFILFGAAVFAVVGLLSASVENSYLLIALRFLQGLAAGTSASVGRAVIADQYTGVDRARKYGALASTALLAPVVAPLAGGLLHTVSNWRTVFVFLGLLGIVMLAAAIFGVPETHSRSADASKRPQTSMLRVSFDLIKRPQFVMVVLIQCLATGGFFVYIGGSSFVLEEQFHVSSLQYSLIFASNAVAMVAANLVFTRTVARLGLQRLLWIGVGISLAATLTLVATALATSGHMQVWQAWLPLLFIVGGMGFTQSATTVLGQNAGSDAAGTASSLLSGSAFLVGSATTPSTGLVGNGIQGMALTMAGLFLASALLLATAARRQLLVDVRR